MLIEYQIKRFDLVKAYFYNLQHSRRTRLIIFGVASILFVYFLYLPYRINSHLLLNDFIVAVLFAIGFILFIPALSFITAKTRKRILSNNPDGIETKIGSKEGKILWKAVDSIATTQDRILITGKTANAFSIPTRAFKDAEQRNQFIDLATQYHANANLQE